MQNLPDFVREDDAGPSDVRSTSSMNLTGWETVIFQLGEEGPDSDSSTALLAP